MPIQQWVKKSLLEAIEATGKPSENVSLIDICQRAPGVFGESGELKRPTVQYHFNNLKCRSIRSWADYLDKFKVTHGEATIRLLLEQD
jgi:predicted N-acyltransferase